MLVQTLGLKVHNRLPEIAAWDMSISAIITSIQLHKTNHPILNPSRQSYTDHIFFLTQNEKKLIPLWVLYRRSLASTKWQKPFTQISQHSHPQPWLWFRKVPRDFKNILFFPWSCGFQFDHKTAGRGVNGLDDLCSSVLSEVGFLNGFK